MGFIAKGLFSGNSKGAANYTSSWRIKINIYVFSKILLAFRCWKTRTFVNSYFTFDFAYFIILLPLLELWFGCLSQILLVRYSRCKFLSVLLRFEQVYDYMVGACSILERFMEYALSIFASSSLLAWFQKN